MKKRDRNSPFVYSTNPDFTPEPEEHDDQHIPASGQQLRIYPDKRNRNGKIVTVVSGFQGGDDELKSLEKQLKSLCGSGGTIKDGDILIQGQFIDKIATFLEKQGYRYKISGV